MTYRAPVADILYSLKHVAGFATAIDEGRFGELDLDTAEAVIAEAGKFATEAIAPLDVVGDREGARCANGVVTTPPGFRDAYRRWAEAGWAGVTAKPEYGGMGLPHAVAAACSEMWSARRWASRSVRCSARARSARSRSMAATTLRATYLGRLVTGEWTGTMNLTEPQAGSDLSAVKTRAERARRRDLSPHRPEDLHHLRRTRPGRQHRPSRAGAPARRAARHARHFAVPGAEIPRQAGRLARAPATTCAAPRIEHKLGIHASPTCVMVYGDAGGATAYLVGEENRGLAAMFVMMNAARLGVGLQGVAIGEQAYQTGAGLRARAPPGPRRRRRRRHEPDRRASRRPAHAA